MLRGGYFVLFFLLRFLLWCFFRCCKMIYIGVGFRKDKMELKGIIFRGVLICKGGFYFGEVVSVIIVGFYWLCRGLGRELIKFSFC